MPVSSRGHVRAPPPPTPWNYCPAMDRLSTRAPESDLDMATSTAHPSVCILHFLPSVK